MKVLLRDDVAGVGRRGVSASSVAALTTPLLELTDVQLALTDVG